KERAMTGCGSILPREPVLLDTMEKPRDGDRTPFQTAACRYLCAPKLRLLSDPESKRFGTEDFEPKHLSEPTAHGSYIEPAELHGQLCNGPNTREVAGPHARVRG